MYFSLQKVDCSILLLLDLRKNFFANKSDFWVQQYSMGRSSSWWLLPALHRTQICCRDWPCLSPWQFCIPGLGPGALDVLLGGLALVQQAFLGFCMRTARSHCYCLIFSTYASIILFWLLLLSLCIQSVLLGFHPSLIGFRVEKWRYQAQLPFAREL